MVLTSFEFLYVFQVIQAANTLIENILYLESAIHLPAIKQFCHFTLGLNFLTNKMKALEERISKALSVYNQVTQMFPIPQGREILLFLSSKHPLGTNLRIGGHSLQNQGPA